MPRNVRTVFAALLIVLATAGVGATTASSEVVDVDRQWRLASSEAVDAYQTDEAATARMVAGHDLTVTIAEDSSDVPLGGIHWDPRYTYLHVSYAEDIPRTYRLYVPSEYFRPRVKEDLAAEDAPVTVDLRPTEDNEWTILTIRFDGATNATYKIGKSAGLVFGGRDYVGEKVNNTTGVSLPSFGTSSPSEDWQYVDRARLAGDNTTVAIHSAGEPVTIQMDVSSDIEESRWVAVPRCERNLEPVCWFRKDGVTDKVYVMSPTEDPPQVRYKAGTDRTAGISGAVEDIRQGIRKTLDGISGWLGGG